MDNQIKKEIGKRLRADRKELNLTETQAGEIIGKELLTIRSYETGHRPPAFEYLHYLATQNMDLKTLLMTA